MSGVLKALIELVSPYHLGTMNPVDQNWGHQLKFLFKKNATKNMKKNKTQNHRSSFSLSALDLQVSAQSRVEARNLLHASYKD
jgi:hypothetical protein